MRPAVSPAAEMLAGKVARGTSQRPGAPILTRMMSGRTLSWVRVSGDTSGPSCGSVDDCCTSVTVCCPLPAINTPR